MDSASSKPQRATHILDESGAVLVEYALVLALLSVGLLGGMKAVGTATSLAYNYVTAELLHYAQRDGS